MFLSLAVRVVDFCRRFAWPVALFALFLSLGLGAYVVQSFRMNTDVDGLLADGLAWRDLEKDLSRAFPQTENRLVIVVDGANPDVAEKAASSLAKALARQPGLFKNVKRPDAIPYFRRNGFLFLSQEELTETLENLVKAQPFLGSLAKDPSLRGLFQTMGLTVEGIKRGQARYGDLEPSFRLLSQAVNAVLEGRETTMPWRSLMSDQKPGLRELRKFILTQPALDYGALSPGGKATAEVRRLAQTMGLTPENGVTVRLTGSVALNDEEFASVADGMEMSLVLSFVLVVGLLFLALRSGRIIVPVVLTLLAGLVATTAFAMAAVGSLNLISVAFAVMFVGIAVDFGIQFAVKFRERRHENPDLPAALRETAAQIAPPLALAAAATTLGFLAFIPTDYRGVSELGIIASAGMAIAFLFNLTLLPALLAIFRPPAEPEAIGYAWALPIDRFLVRRRKPLLILVGAVTLLALLLASRARFDFDPLNLKDPGTESVRTMFDIMQDPDATPYTIQILAPSLAEAQKLAGEIEKLPEVDHTIALDSFVPKEQEEKLALIADAKFLLDPSLHPASPLPAPTNEENRASLRGTAAKLRALGEDKAAAQNLADALEKAAKRDDALLGKLDAALIDGMKAYLNQIGLLLDAKPVTLADVSDDLRRDWIAPDGRARLEVYPKGDARDPRVLEAFTKAVRAVAPYASGTPVSIQESGRTVLGAFIKAGILALVAIALLGFSVLRRIGDAARLLLPLILAGILTLATMVTISLPLNFANIIALPLLMSLGVSYAIYVVSYWRAGKENPLSSSMARAVLFSAATTLVAFGSLSLSSHPGTSGMGGLLTIALLYCLVTTFLILPLLLGRKR